MRNYLLGLFIVLSCCGCPSLFKATEDKRISLDSTVYALKIKMVDPASGDMAPVSEVGFGRTQYESMPVMKGQAFYNHVTTYTFWTGKLESESTTWIGPFLDSGRIEMLAVPSTMVVVTKDGTIKSGSYTVKTPEVK